MASSVYISREVTQYNGAACKPRGEALDLGFAASRAVGNGLPVSESFPLCLFYCAAAAREAKISGHCVRTGRSCCLTHYDRLTVGSLAFPPPVPGN